jgi:hypothetical protein
MSLDFELFPGKNLSGLFEDIYNNQLNKKKYISEVIHEMRKLIIKADDVEIVGPIIKDLIDTSVKNDDLLVKLATVAQRIMVSVHRNEGDTGYLTEQERKQLLADIDTIQSEVDKLDSFGSEIDDVKNKLVN